MADSYCKAIESGKLSELHKTYHDTEYGFPAKSDNELFGRMLLEINQAGLSWNTILNKKQSIKSAYAQFAIEKVAKFDESDIERLLQDPGIIRMRLKVLAAINNAQVIMQLQASHGSFKNWLDAQYPKTHEEWAKIFKKTFRFMGKEITKEFLQGTGYMKGTHDDDCPVLQEIIKQNPKWLEE